MTFTLSVIFFILGLVVGSFLNVVVLRFNSGKSFGGRSQCFSCKKTLSWKELVPVLSYLFLKGRCKSCKSRISIQYPLVELATALVFVGVFLKIENLFYSDILLFTAAFAFYAIIFSLLISISVYDIKHKVIPDIFVLIFGVLAFLGIFFFSGNIFDPHIPGLPELLSGLLFAAPFALLWLISSGRWMGFGDAKLALGLGWFLGPAASISAFFLAFWSGALVGLALIAFKKVSGLKSEVPFAPFLVLGAILAFLFEFNFFPF